MVPLPGERSVAGRNKYIWAEGRGGGERSKRCLSVTTGLLIDTIYTYLDNNIDLCWRHTKFCENRTIYCWVDQKTMLINTASIRPPSWKLNLYYGQRNLVIVLIYCSVQNFTTMCCYFTEIWRHPPSWIIKFEIFYIWRSLLSGFTL